MPSVVPSGHGSHFPQLPQRKNCWRLRGPRAKGHGGVVKVAEFFTADRLAIMCVKKGYHNSQSYITHCDMALLVLSSAVCIIL